MQVPLSLFSASVQVLLVKAIVQANNKSESYIQKVLDIYTGNQSLSDREEPMTGYIFCPLILLVIWITSLCFMICTCLYCKFIKKEVFTSYDSNSFEIHIIEPPLDHIKGCACFECLRQRQLTKEMELKNGKTKEIGIQN